MIKYIKLVAFLVLFAFVCLVVPAQAAAPAQARAVMTKFFQTMKDKNYKAQVELLDPAMFKKLAKQNGQSVAAMKKSYIEFMSDPKEMLEVKSFEIIAEKKIPATKHAPTKYAFKIKEVVEDKDGERETEEIGYVVLKNGRWYVQPAGK